MLRFYGKEFQLNHITKMHVNFVKKNLGKFRKQNYANLLKNQILLHIAQA